MPHTLSEKVVKWCTETKSATQLLEENLTKSPGEVAKELFGHESISIGDSNKSPAEASRISSDSPILKPPRPDDEELEVARRCGNWGTSQPSELFLRLYHAALLTLEHDPLAGVVSPSLMGTTGVIPLTVIGIIEDVCRHMSNLIVRAEEEVFFATNYWQASGATTFITDAIRELDRRAGRRRKRIVFKMMYDRGNFKQVFHNHQVVKPSEWTGDKIAIPDPKEIPNIDLQIINYHRPALGTFHAKFMVVDRKFGAVCSNNVMANENLEMMTNLEGLIVNSLYDVCMLSWEHALEPQMPAIKSPPVWNGCPSFSDPEFTSLVDQNGQFKMPEFTGLAVETDTLNHGRLPSHMPRDPHYDNSYAGEILRNNAAFRPMKGETHMQLVCEHLNRPTKAPLKPTAPEPTLPSDRFTPLIPLPPHEPFPIALVNRKPAGAPNNSSIQVPQNAAWVSALRHAKRKVFIQSPDVNAKPLIPEIIAAVKRGIEVEVWMCLGYNDAGELLPGQGGTNEMITAQMVDELKAEGPEVRRRLKTGWYVGKDQDRAIHKKEGGRTCHIKLMIVDDHVGIQGSGNQDTQSWFHSQEINIMIDSPLVCEAWRDGIRRNQNTHIYGMGSEVDGLWHDKDGNQAPDAIGRDPGSFSWAKGVIGAIQRARGIGGF